jgi:hypothetical protein
MYGLLLRKHGMKYQSVYLPMGFYACMPDPEMGARHDGYMLRQSNLEEQLEIILYSLIPYKRLKDNGKKVSFSHIAVLSVNMKKAPKVIILSLLQTSMNESPIIHNLTTSFTGMA